MPRKKAIKLSTPDYQRYAVIRRGSVEWEIAMALATPRERHVYQRIGVNQYERSSEPWSEIQRRMQQRTV